MKTYLMILLALGFLGGCAAKSSETLASNSETAVKMEASQTEEVKEEKTEEKEEAVSSEKSDEKKEEKTEEVKEEPKKE